jgi:legumain
VILLSILAILGGAHAATWAVLVAGSNGYYNYRHQADICHAYQSLVKGGLSPANIITFAYDDIANNSQNPYKGKLFNRPNGSDVYAGCVIDYKGADVTPKNFLTVLKQDAQSMSGIGSGRVLKSTANDKVFINFSDHGAPGLIAFPSQYLYATDLTPVLNGMWSNKQYQELVFYLEACESGSMFTTFPTNQKLYALTAANPNESSWASYCPPDDVVGGKELGSCLGDLFSTNWMENTDATDMTKETLAQQFQVVQKLTSASHVMQYGDLSFNSEAGSNFVGKGNNPSALKTETQGSIVNSRDVKLMYLINRHATLLSAESQDELNKEILSRKLYDTTFKQVKNIVGQIATAETTDFDCYKDMIESFENVCGKTSDYGLKYFRVFYDICNCPTCDRIAVKNTLVKNCINAITA